jgi:hypothetical protein
VSSSARIVIINSCSDLKEEDYEAAVERRPNFLALWGQLADKAEPGQECGKLLALLARVAGAMWLDGDLRVEMMQDGDKTVVELLTELGGGLRERVYQPTTFRIPLSELIAAIAKNPSALEPLGVRSRSPRRVVLLANAGTSKSTLPPPDVKVKGAGSEPPTQPKVKSGVRIPLSPKAPVDLHIRKKPAPKE